MGGVEAGELGSGRDSRGCGWWCLGRFLVGVTGRRMIRHVIASEWDRVLVHGISTLEKCASTPTRSSPPQSFLVTRARLATIMLNCGARQHPV